jgi:hypothetical protein
MEPQHSRRKERQKISVAVRARHPIYWETVYVHARVIVKAQHPPACPLVGIVLVVAEMEVVVLGVADDKQEHNGVNDRLRRRVLAKVLGLVLAENAGSLDSGSGAAGELLVEVDNALHADSVRGRTNGLRGSNLGRDERRKRPACDVAHVGKVRGARSQTS